MGSVCGGGGGGGGGIANSPPNHRGKGSTADNMVLANSWKCGRVERKQIGINDLRTPNSPH